MSQIKELLNKIEESSWSKKGLPYYNMGPRGGRPDDYSKGWIVSTIIGENTEVSYSFDPTDKDGYVTSIIDDEGSVFINNTPLKSEKQARALAELAVKEINNGEQPKSLKQFRED